MSRKRKKRKKTSRKNLKWDNTWNENTNALLDDEDFNIHKFRLDIVYITRDQMKRWDSRDTWHTESDEGRIKLMLEDRKSKSLYKNYYLSNALTRVLKSVLDRVYAKYFGEKRMSKKARIQELTFAFYDEESPMDKREVEEDNIEAIGNLEEEFNFFELCNILLPKEIIFQIFEFLDRNYDMLTTVGTICQHFYVHLLSTWNHINVTERNLYKISLIALKTSKSMRIRELTKPEQDYLWSKVAGNKRLRKIDFQMSALKLRSTLSVLQNLKKKRSTNSSNYPVQNVQEINLRENHWGKVKLLNSSFNEIFPSLKKVRGSLRREFELKLFQNSPNVEHIVLHDIDDSWRVRDQIDRVEPGKKYLDITRIKKLEIQSFRWSSNLNSKLRNWVLKYLNFFQHIEVLSLHSQVSSWGDGITDGTRFDLSKMFSMCPKLKVLSIVDKQSDHHGSEDSLRTRHDRNEANGDQSIRVTYSTSDLNVEKLKIISSTLRYTYTRPLDFNLEELLSSNFLLNQQSLKSFIGDVPLFKRSRCLSLIQKDETKNFEEEMEKLMTVVHNFMKFLTDSMVSEFNHFEVTIRSRDLYFREETIKFIFNNSNSSIQGLKVMKVVLGGVRVERGKWRDGKYDYSQIEHFVKPLGLRTRYDSSFDELDNKLNSKVFLMKEKRPCLLLLMYFLEKAMNQMQNQIDIFCFDFLCLEKNKKSVRKSWKKVILGIVEERGEKFMKDFVFDEEDISFVRSNLL